MAQAVQWRARRCARWPKKWAAKNAKNRCNYGQSTNIDARRLGVRVIGEEMNMNRETVQQIVKEDLGMRKISTKMVPRILTHDQKQRWLHIISIYAMQRCLIGSLPVMKHGVFNTTRKQNDRTCSGKHRVHLGWKKRAYLGLRSWPCLCVSSITRG